MIIIKFEKEYKIAENKDKCENDHIAYLPFDMTKCNAKYDCKEAIINIQLNAEAKPFSSSESWSCIFKVI